MKASITEYASDVFEIVIEPETMEESVSLVRLGLGAKAKSSVVSTYAWPNGIKSYVNIGMRHDMRDEVRP
jgi:hypothetical protein